MIQVEEYLSTHSSIIEEHLDKIIPSDKTPYQHLFEAARYSVLGGGKRIRPILALATTEMLDGDLDLALSPACTLELVHTYSLIHDDLPCMDDDDYRRGKLTVHKKYSEGHAVLTGDYLLTYAFELLANHPRLSAETKIKLISTLAKSIGSHGMIGGQVMDVVFEGKKIPLEMLRQLHQNKTGALITASIEFGGILSNADPNQMKLLREFGKHIGLAFQVVDDILDVTATQAKHGRTISSDILNDKTTYVTLLGLEGAKKTAQDLYKSAIQTLEPFKLRSSPLLQIADYIIHRNH